VRQWSDREEVVIPLFFLIPVFVQVQMLIGKYVSVIGQFVVFRLDKTSCVRDRRDWYKSGLETDKV
jgi:hypothetical protein